VTTHTLKIVRVVISVAFLTLLLAAFLLPGESPAWTAFAARVQFLPAFITMVFAGGGIVGIAWIAILLVTGLFGRLYCSSLCPLGTVQDVATRGARGRSGHGYRRRLRHRPSRLIVARAIAVASILLLAFGAPVLVNLLGPYRFFGMLAKDFVVPLVALLSHGAYFVLRPVGIFVAPLVVPVDGVLFLVAFAAAGGLVTLSAIGGRLFCNTLCPVGGILSLPAARSLMRVTIEDESCIRCGACEHVCKAGCIDSAAKHVDTARCVTCFNCLSVCPVDAIHYRRVGGEATARSEAGRSRRGLTRRRFLARLGSSTLAVFPLSFLIRRRSGSVDGTPGGPPIRAASPPGSGSVARFTSLCVSCHLCVTRCPTQVLQPSLAEYGLRGIMQPTMDYATGFCEYECNACSTVCPTGAISPITLEEKQKTQIGQAHFIRDRCVVITNGTACGACAEVCPTHAVYMVPHTGHLTIPETDMDVCVGCGNCEFACPVEPTKAIVVSGNEVHHPRVVKETDGEPTIVEPEPAEEFPF
jgi:ferredoxin